MQHGAAAAGAGGVSMAGLPPNEHGQFKLEDFTQFIEEHFDVIVISDVIRWLTTEGRIPKAEQAHFVTAYVAVAMPMIEALRVDIADAEAAQEPAPAAMAQLALDKRHFKELRVKVNAVQRIFEAHCAIQSKFALEAVVAEALETADRTGSSGTSAGFDKHTRTSIPAAFPGAHTIQHAQTMMHRRLLERGVTLPPERTLRALRKWELFTENMLDDADSLGSITQLTDFISVMYDVLTEMAQPRGDKESWALPTFRILLSTSAKPVKLLRQAAGRAARQTKAHGSACRLENALISAWCKRVNETLYTVAEEWWIGKHITAEPERTPEELAASAIEFFTVDDILETAQRETAWTTLMEAARDKSGHGKPDTHRSKKTELDSLKPPFNKALRTFLPDLKKYSKEQLTTELKKNNMKGWCVRYAFDPRCCNNSKLNKDHHHDGNWTEKHWQHITVDMQTLEQQRSKHLK
jgi:hypothetical protein